MSAARPLLAALERIGQSFPQTPLVPLEHDRLDLFAKLEFANPNASSKDRSAFWILKSAIERGDVGEGATIVESSSGNFALSLATLSRALGLSFVPVIDPNVNASTEAYLRALCDRVEKVSERDGTGGYLANRLARVAELRTQLPAAYWPNQYANPDALLAHYRLTGGELCRELRRLDYVFVGVSTGGTISGLSLRVKEAFPNARVVAVDAAGSAIFGSSPCRRLIPGIGSSIVPPLVGHALIDDVVIVSEEEAIAGCHRLLHRHGIYAGGSTGSVYAAIERYFAGSRGRRPTVAFLCADRGAAYADTVYDRAWVANAFPGAFPDGPADPERELVGSSV
ncbi:2,3-diaminopropionate biosynthesis protein SbnA [Motilibacter deserti]|uniref:2,3-diaminopropionate biosynthesis protein SbnA n=1 Tax=Motilibacter deserti TaxID=2714956 RepID=A0ABX0GZP7_9ACTN|nr:2,3-diaminopropionate biosynthesis protein SbnA [Motilibacter deserti]NHC16043.1 2,3-diaminopropionate biosynthesis protein SbnA [Motilibacter deserti]